MLCHDASWHRELALAAFTQQAGLSQRDAEAFVAFLWCARFGNCCGDPVSHLSTEQMLRIEVTNTHWHLVR